MKLIPDSAIKNFESLLSSYHIEISELLIKVGVSDEQLINGYWQIDSQQFIDVMEYAATVLNQRFIGVEFGEMSTSTALGNLWFLLKNSSSISELLNNLVKNYAIFSSAAYFSLEHDHRGTTLIYDVSSNISGPTTQAIEAALTSSCLELRRYIAPDWTPAAVYFKTDKPTETGPLAKIFGHNLHFNQEINGFLITPQQLKQPIREAKALDFHHYNFELTLQSDFHRVSLATQTENIINSNLTKHKCSLEFVADCLNTRPRTLQHRLAKAGTSYKRILQQAQLNTAMHFLQHSSLSVTEISIRLQFAEVSVFSRFIKNSTGRPPKQHRQLAPAAASRSSTC